TMSKRERSSRAICPTSGADRRPIPRYGPRYHNRELVGAVWSKAWYRGALRCRSPHEPDFTRQGDCPCMSVRGCIRSLLAFDRDPSCADGRWVAFQFGFDEFLRLAGVSPVTIPFIGVVDDDESLCLSLADLMRSVGYRSEAFTSAETLLGYADLLSFDCII